MSLSGDLGIAQLMAERLIPHLADLVFARIMVEQLSQFLIFPGSLVIFGRLQVNLVILPS